MNYQSYLVTESIARYLKLLGYDVPTHFCYDIGGFCDSSYLKPKDFFTGINYNSTTQFRGFCSAPYRFEVFKWIKENFSMEYETFLDNDDKDHWRFLIKFGEKIRDKLKLEANSEFRIYESERLAELAGIEHMIKIIFNHFWEPKFEPHEKETTSK